MTGTCTCIVVMSNICFTDCMLIINRYVLLRADQRSDSACADQ